MKRTLQGLLVLTLAVVLAMPAMAAEEKKKKKKKGRKAPVAVKVPKGIELTADQKKQVAAINKEFAPKLLEINKKRSGIITPEQNKARSAAAKKAKADGMSEDDQKVWEGEVQDMTNKFIAQIDEQLESKQAEIMQV